VETVIIKWYSISKIKELFTLFWGGDALRTSNGPVLEICFQCFNPVLHGPSFSALTPTLSVYMYLDFGSFSRGSLVNYSSIFSFAVGSLSQNSFKLQMRQLNSAHGMPLKSKDSRRRRFSNTSELLQDQFSRLPSIYIKVEIVGLFLIS
jgi:hypothetical protein